MKFIKPALIILALAGVILLASVPDFSTKANVENSFQDNDDEIIIDKTIHDFGIISENDENVKATFTLKNRSKTPIIITNVAPSCGCTTPDWTKEPISPGKSGKVTAIFDPKNRVGLFDKSIVILTTGKPERIVVRIKGSVQ